MQLTFYAGSTLGRRSEQQDSYTYLALNNGYHLFVLADGMGGHAGGEIASQTVCSIFYNMFYNTPVITDPAALLLQGMMSSNEAVKNAQQGRRELDGMGSTLIAVLFHESTGLFHFISVGDSPLYRFSPEQGLIRINANHAYYETLKLMVAKGLISQEDADNHPNRHAINSAIMGEEISHIDQQSGALYSGQCLLLASDGVQTLSDSQFGPIAAVLASEALPENAVNMLFSAVADANEPHQDNTTLVLVALDAHLRPAVDLPRPLPEAPPSAAPPFRHNAPENHTNRPMSFIQRRAGLIIALLCLVIVGLIAGIWLGAAMTKPDPTPPGFPLRDMPTQPENIPGRGVILDPKKIQGPEATPGSEPGDAPVWGPDGMPRNEGNAGAGNEQSPGGEGNQQPGISDILKSIERTPLPDKKNGDKKSDKSDLPGEGKGQKGGVNETGGKSPVQEGGADPAQQSGNRKAGPRGEASSTKNGNQKKSPQGKAVAPANGPTIQEQNGSPQLEILPGGMQRSNTHP